MQEIRVQSLGREDPLEEEMAARSSFLAWEIAWTEEPGGLQPTESYKSQTRLCHYNTYYNAYSYLLTPAVSPKILQ